VLCLGNWTQSKVRSCLVSIILRCLNLYHPLPKLWYFAALQYASRAAILLYQNSSWRDPLAYRCNIFASVNYICIWHIYAPMHRSSNMTTPGQQLCRILQVQGPPKQCFSYCLRQILALIQQLSNRAPFQILTWPSADQTCQLCMEGMVQASW
jgi:hypothetical protein